MSDFFDLSSSNLSKKEAEIIEISDDENEPIPISNDEDDGAGPSVPMQQVKENENVGGGQMRSAENEFEKNAADGEPIVISDDEDDGAGPSVPMQQITENIVAGQMRSTENECEKNAADDEPIVISDDEDVGDNGAPSVPTDIDGTGPSGLVQILTLSCPGWGLESPFSCRRQLMMKTMPILLKQLTPLHRSTFRHHSAQTK